jgi:hypothetical protein
VIVDRIHFSIAAIGAIRGLPFYLAVYALSLFVGLPAGMWSYLVSTGWLRCHHGRVHYRPRNGPHRLSRARVRKAASADDCNDLRRPGGDRS